MIHTPTLLALVVCVCAPLAVSHAAEKPATSLRLVAYNIKHGRGMDGRIDLDRTAGVLKKLKPDLVALQEIDNKCERSGGIDEAEALGRALGMKHRFAKFMDFEGGEYGLAVLSRFPVTEANRHQLSPGAEPRCALEVVVKPGEGVTAVSFVSIHHDWTSEAFRVAQVKDLLEALAARNHPVILAGDFNARPGDKSLALLTGAGFSMIDKDGAKTFPSTKPRVEIDYFFTRGIEFTSPPVSYVHDERLASDHRPIVATIPLAAAHD